MTSRIDEMKALLPTEAALCAAFMEQFNAIDGWTCFPETCGFDIVVAHESGRQIGVEAKQQLNSKVASQILPRSCRYGAGEGPDHRLVIVRSITDANAGIARMLGMLGVEVWSPNLNNRMKERGVFEAFADFHIADKLYWEEKTTGDDGCPSYAAVSSLFDWNPEKRLVLPELPGSLQAGIPAPVQATPWKQCALRVVARLRTQGFITAKQIVEEGISPSLWMAQWLDRGQIRGQWVETDRVPKFDQQHPELYALALSKAQAKAAEPFALES